MGTEGTYVLTSCPFFLSHTQRELATVLQIYSQYTQKHRALRGGGV